MVQAFNTTSRRVQAKLILKLMRPGRHWRVGQSLGRSKQRGSNFPTPARTKSFGICGTSSRQVDEPKQDQEIKLTLLLLGFLPGCPHTIAGGLQQLTSASLCINYSHPALVLQNPTRLMSKKFPTPSPLLLNYLAATGSIYFWGVDRVLSTSDTCSARVR